MNVPSLWQLPVIGHLAADRTVPDQAPLDDAGLELRGERTAGPGLLLRHMALRKALAPALGEDQGRDR